VRRRSIITVLVQGIIAGGVLAYITASLVVNADIKAMHTTVNGWTTTLKCGALGNNPLLRAACAKDLPAANLPARRSTGRPPWTARVTP
jgi:hypothetical protein